MTDTERGLYVKYDVRRLGGTPGKHTNCEFFVLDLQHDVYARDALRAYATACRAIYPALAADLDFYVDLPPAQNTEATRIVKGSVSSDET